ncbi:uncharacterized protein IUM83_17943 [Phytophthora cinnamomi]|uniref:uncharacterized protein n=1 Tax=Phytophthora cinnamomi TaxID=4785 RepID=UPI003559D140|nr:hypothetical protein IUM83_17943 [Phytophthora cinnamomi]
MTNDSSPYQTKISLTPSDSTQLQVVAKAILDANLDRYQLFSDVENGRVDPSLWKLVKTNNEMSAYLQRQRRLVSFPFQVDPGHDNCALQSLLCVGSTPSKLDRVMDKVANPREGDMSRAALLATITKPTTSDPFKSIKVKWMDLNVRFQSLGLVKNHDYVYVEATGVLHLPSGGRLGYQLLHSVDVPGAHDLPGLVRSKLSVCSFFRQIEDNSVSVYSLGMMDSMSDRARRAVVPRFIKLMLPSTQGRGDTMRLTLASAKRYTSMNLAPQNLGGSCSICSKRVLRLGKLLNRHSSCSVCSARVCSSCKIEKNVRLVSSDMKVTRRKFVFCSPSPCLENAMAQNETELSLMDNADGLARFYTADFRSVWQSRSRITTSGRASWSIAC